MILLMLGAALAGDLPLDTSLSLTPDGAFVLRFVPSEAWRSVEVRVGAEEVQELGPLAAGVAVELKGRTTWAWPTVVSFSGQIDDRRGFLITVPVETPLEPSPPPDVRRWRPERTGR